MGKATSSAIAHRGHIFHLAGDCDLAGARAALREHRDGVLLVDGAGRVLACGDAAEVPLPDGTLVEDHRGRILLPGFIDTHLHFPQVHLRHAFEEGGLLDWLERSVFPGEARLADPARASMAARDFVEALLRSGTTTALVFGSQFPHAQAALVDAATRAGLRLVLGRTLMTQGPRSAEPLLLPLAESLRLCREEIAAWHPRAPGGAPRLQVALVPRFALSLDRRGFRELGELCAEVRERGVYLATHLSEDAGGPRGEVARVRRHFGVRDYLDVYDGRAGRRPGPSLLGCRSVFAHAVHTTARERRRLAATGSGVAHCPTSQLYLGGRTMPLSRLQAAGVKIGLGSDVGAGDSFCLGSVLNAAWKVHRGARPPRTLHPAELLHLATQGGAQVLDLGRHLGSFDPGKEADFQVLDPQASPLLARRLADLDDQAGGSSADRLFAILMGMAELPPPRVHVGGRPLRA
jgi:guanine deaminase